MKAHLLLSATVLLAALATPAAGAATTVTVTLEVGDHYHLLPAATTCDVAVPTGADAGDVLDAAIAAGCISTWSATDYGQPGAPDRFIECIDARCSELVFAWAFYENGALAPYGIDGYAASEGDVVSFYYSSWAAFFLP